MDSGNELRLLQVYRRRTHYNKTCLFACCSVHTVQLIARDRESAGYKEFTWPGTCQDRTGRALSGTSGTAASLVSSAERYIVVED